jgi:hypothetical protein
LLLLSAGLICFGRKQAADHVDDPVVRHDVRLQDLDVIDQHASFRITDLELRPLERFQLPLVDQLVEWLPALDDVRLRILER